MEMTWFLSAWLKVVSLHLCWFVYQIRTNLSRATPIASGKRSSAYLKFCTPHSALRIYVGASLSARHQSQLPFFENRVRGTIFGPRCKISRLNSPDIWDFTHRSSVPACISSILYSSMGARPRVLPRASCVWFSEPRGTPRLASSESVVTTISEAWPPSP